MLDRAAPLLLGDDLHRSLFSEDADVVADGRQVLLGEVGEFLGAQHPLLLDVEPQQPLAQRVPQDVQKRLFGIALLGGTLPTSLAGGHRGSASPG